MVVLRTNSIQDVKVVAVVVEVVATVKEIVIIVIEIVIEDDHLLEDLVHHLDTQDVHAAAHAHQDITDVRPRVHHAEEASPLAPAQDPDLITIKQFYPFYNFLSNFFLSGFVI